MAISSYVSESGETLWKGYVNVRSKTNPALRAQRRFTGIKSRRDAEREETRLIRECERELFEKESQGALWGAVVEAYASYLQSPAEDDLNQRTKFDYVASVRKHTQVFWKRAASEITTGDFREVFQQLKLEGISGSHLGKIKVAISRIYQFGIERNLIQGIERSPTYGIRLKREEEEKKPEILTLNEIKKLLDAAKTLDSRWYEIWAMALLTGMRSGELYALTWSDVDFEHRTITVSKSYNCALNVTKTTKAGYWRSVPVSTQLHALLVKLKVKTGHTPYVLPRIWQWTNGFQAQELRKFCLGLGIPSVRFHALRACFATQLIRAGVPAIQIQKICGWRDLKTMQRYIRLAGIEIDGATERLEILPSVEIMDRAEALFVESATPAVSAQPVPAA